MPKFDEDENKQIDKEIKELITNMTLKVKKAEGNIKKLSKMTLQNQSEEDIKNNMKINLAEKIKNFTQEFKANEQKYVNNYKELVGDTNEEDEKNKFNYSNNSNEGFLNVHADNQLERRDEEISTLLNSINQLATTFQDLQVIVQEQGTILDRIDYNIDTTVTNVQSAHKHLKEATRRMRKNCFRNATMTLLSVIFVESVILLFRFT